MTLKLIAQDRKPALGYRYAVASSSPAISAVGAQVLLNGGNAIDASLAMAALGWVVIPGQSGVGGDLFAIIREPDGRVWTVNGSGEGPAGAEAAAFRERGMTTLPTTGPLSVAVPGAMGAVRTLHRSGASMDLAELWAPAIDAARTGYPCTQKLRRDIGAQLPALQADATMSRDFLRRDDVPSLGTRITQPDLAESLLDFAADPDAFYRGAFADRAVEFLRQQGALFDGSEWERGLVAPPMEPLATTYQGHTLYQTPLPSCGWMMVQQARIVDGQLNSRPQLDAHAVHWLASAARVAFRDRYLRCGSDSAAWRDVLTDTHIQQCRREIESRVLVSNGISNRDGDTTCTVAVDDEGRAVALIHSLAFTFGAALVVPGTGVVLNNRLARGAYLVEGHPNELKPGRKPLHTLNAWLVEDANGDLAHVGACPGGDGQVQWNMQILSHLIDHGDNPVEAVSRPRFAVFPGSDANRLHEPPAVQVEAGLGQEVIDTLRHWGHPVREVPVQVGGVGGSAMVVSRDPATHTLSAGADPRLDGVALAM